MESKPPQHVLINMRPLKGFGIFEILPNKKVDFIVEIIFYFQCKDDVMRSNTFLLDLSMLL